MSPLDLDAVQTRAQRVKDWRWQAPEIGMGKLWAAVEESQADIPAVVAELRAAREVNFDLHQLAIDLDAHDLTAAAAHRLRNILRRWDKTAGEVPR